MSETKANPLIIKTLLYAPSDLMILVQKDIESRGIPLTACPSISFVDGKNQIEVTVEE
jgi:hypothetical protein